jgi:hypothetical protein
MLLDQAEKTFREEEDDDKRASMCDLLLALPELMFPMQRRLGLFMTSLECVSKETRYHCFHEMRRFAPHLLSTLGEPLALAWFQEIKRIQIWWP